MCHKTQANTMLFSVSFYGKYFCAFLHEFSFRATLHKFNCENKVEAIIEVKASKKGEETRWMICIHFVPSSYEICKGFPCFQRKVNNYRYFYNRKGEI